MDRKRILNFRRLPAWILSYMHHTYLHYGLEVDADLARTGHIAGSSLRPIGRRFYLGAMPRLRRFRVIRRVLNKILTKGVAYTHPDNMLKTYEPEHVEHWIRQERLADDFLAVMRILGEISEDQQHAIRTLGYVNRNSYDHDWKQVFAPEDLDRIYAMNPVWASIERAVYGSTL